MPCIFFGNVFYCFHCPLPPKTPYPIEHGLIPRKISVVSMFLKITMCAKFSNCIMDVPKGIRLCPPARPWIKMTIWSHICLRMRIPVHACKYERVTISGIRRNLIAERIISTDVSNVFVSMRRLSLFTSNHNSSRVTDGSRCIITKQTIDSFAAAKTPMPNASIFSDRNYVVKCCHTYPICICA